MNFVRIFDDEDFLLSTHYQGEKLDEFSKLFHQWTDTKYLHDFFSTNEDDLKRPYWEGITIEQAIIETRKETIKFGKYLKSISKRPQNERISIFSRFFKPLDKQLDLPFLAKKKVYGIRKKTWLRLYALKVGDDMFIITGGTIKLIDNMIDRDHTNIELKKLDICRQFLISEKIVDEDGVIEFLEI